MLLDFAAPAGAVRPPGHQGTALVAMVAQPILPWQLSPGGLRSPRASRFLQRPGKQPYSSISGRRTLRASALPFARLARFSTSLATRAPCNLFRASENISLIEFLNFPFCRSLRLAVEDCFDGPFVVLTGLAMCSSRSTASLPARIHSPRSFAQDSLACHRVCLTIYFGRASTSCVSVFVPSAPLPRLLPLVCERSPGRF